MHRLIGGSRGKFSRYFALPHIIQKPVQTRLAPLIFISEYTGHTLQSKLLRDRSVRSLMLAGVEVLRVQGVWQRNTWQVHIDKGAGLPRGMQPRLASYLLGSSVQSQSCGSAPSQLPESMDGMHVPLVLALAPN